jgi:hypothetical protein
MKSLISSAVLTVVAVPFLMAAPAPKKAQAPAAEQTQNAPAKTKKAKKHVKKVQNNAPAASANSSAPAK